MSLAPVVQHSRPVTQSPVRHRWHWHAWVMLLFGGLHQLLDHGMGIPHQTLDMQGVGEGNKIRMSER